MIEPEDAAEAEYEPVHVAQVKEPVDIGPVACVVENGAAGEVELQYMTEAGTAAEDGAGREVGGELVAAIEH